MARLTAICSLALALLLAGTPAGAVPPHAQGDVILKDFRFANGETLPNLRIHYLTFGEPRRDAAGVARYRPEFDAVVERVDGEWSVSMSSARPGPSTSDAEVTNISRHGFWVLLDGRELFLPFGEFPWFRSAPVEAILRVERPQADHLYWTALDVDLSVESIEHPDRFPLTSRSGGS